jgi:hypothetical protein
MGAALDRNPLRNGGIEPPLRKPLLLSQLFLGWHGGSAGLKDDGAPPFSLAGRALGLLRTGGGRQRKS